MATGLIALGANVETGGRSLAGTLAEALDRIAAEPGIAVAARSRWYRTPAHPPGSGPDFVNGAARVETELAPEALLAALHGVEAALGRARPARWAPRVCDLDLIAVDGLVLPDRETVERWMALDLGAAQTVSPPRLILPHPRMHERAFVLVPLAEIAPDWRHPVLGRAAAELRDALPEAERRAATPVD